jgi:hypothetical protein
MPYTPEIGVDETLTEALLSFQVEHMDTDEPELVCDVMMTEEDSCGEVICTVQHEDTLYALVAVALAHWNEVHGG